MPSSKTPSGAFALNSSSERTPTVAKTGREEWELIAGALLCATTQMEQDAASVLVAWL
jgi:hypothetical protein